MAFDRDIGDRIQGIKDREKAQNAVKQEKIDERIANNEALQGLSFSGDYNTIAGQMTGLERAEQLYGMNTGEIGQNVQDIVARRRAAMEGNDPASTAARMSRNADVRSARAEGMTDAQIAQVRRSGTNDAAQQDYKSQQQGLSSYQDLVGNILGGTTGMEMGYANLAKSGEEVQAADSGTVICTELHRQGYMSDETLEKDADYGRFIRANAAHVYVGYIFLASPIVSLMKRSPLFTKVISYPALAWANDMAGNKNLIGGLINKYGQILCGYVGKLNRREVCNG